MPCHIVSEVFTDLCHFVPAADEERV